MAQYVWWVKHWPTRQERALGEIDAGPGITGQAGRAFNEWHAEGKDLLTRISRLDGVLFQKEGKDGSQPGEMMRF